MSLCLCSHTVQVWVTLLFYLDLYFFILFFLLFYVHLHTFSLILIFKVILLVLPLNKLSSSRHSAKCKDVINREQCINGTSWEMANSVNIQGWNLGGVDANIKRYCHAVFQLHNLRRCCFIFVILEFMKIMLCSQNIPLDIHSLFTSSTPVQLNDIKYSSVFF